MSTPAARGRGAAHLHEPWSVIGYRTGESPVIGPASDLSHHPTPLLVVQPWRGRADRSAEEWPEWGTQGPRALVVLIPQERTPLDGMGIGEQGKALRAAATAQTEAVASPLAEQIAGPSDLGHDTRFVTLGVAAGIDDTVLAKHLIKMFQRVRELTPPDVPMIAVNYGTAPLPDLAALRVEVVDPEQGPTDMQIAGIATRHFRRALSSQPRAAQQDVPGNPTPGVTGGSTKNGSTPRH